MQLRMLVNESSFWKSKLANLRLRLALQARSCTGARVRRFLPLWFLLWSSTGCSTLFRSYDVTPAGLARGDDALRRLLTSGSADTALHRFGASDKLPAPTDDLLRTLYRGVLAFHAGHSDTSAFLLDRAALLLEDRDGVRISREAAAFLSNDRALPYSPGRTERLLIPYYGALNYLRSGNATEAAVEARRLSFALQSLEDEPKGTDQRTRGVLRYFAGLVFDAAGQRNDAAVSYRNAEKLLGQKLMPTPIPADSGDLVIVVEDGFVAHRFEESLTMVLTDQEADSLRADDRERREHTASTIAARAIAQALRPGRSYSEGPRRPRNHFYIPAPPRQQPVAEECTATQTAQADSAKAQPATATAASEAKQECKDKDDDDFYILRLAWPAYHTIRQPALEARVFLAESARSEVPLFLNVSAAVVSDFERERTRILARTIARAAAKLALVKSAEKGAGKKNEGLGKLVGAIANVSGAVLEQADTRSWTLLPGSIGVIRLRVATGTHPVVLELGGGTATDSQRLDLGTVRVLGGRPVFVTARRW